MRTLLEVNKAVAVLIAPFMPSTSVKILERLGIVKKTSDLRLAEDTSWGALQEGAKVLKGESLFPRVETAGKKMEKPGKQGAGMPDISQKPKEKQEAEAAATSGVTDAGGTIDIDLFQQVDMRVGLIRQAEKVPKSDKLVKLIVDIGEDRQIVAGIAKTHSPADLVGKQVVLVANLKPVKLMGIESHGMILAVRDGQDLKLVVPEANVSPGGKIS